MNRCAIRLCVLSVLLVTTSAIADDAQSIFDSLFSERIRQVKASPNDSDDLALATEMLAALDSVEDKKLVSLICENVFTLASTSAGGSDVAAKAMQQLAAKLPDQRLPALERIADLYKSAYFRARGDARTQLGPVYGEAVASLGDAQFDAGDWQAAIVSYRRAAAPALKLDVSRRTALKSRIDIATDRIQLERKIKTLQATLDANPNDQATAKALAVIHLTHLNDMDAASTAALQSGDAKLITRIKLAGLASAKLTEVQLLDLGEWFRSLAVTANTPTKTKLLSLAHHYNQRFLEQHETKGLSRTKAEITLRSIEASLKRLGVDTSQIAMHLPRRVFKNKTEPPTPPVTITPPVTTKTDPSPPASTSSSIQPKDGWVELIKLAKPATDKKKHQWTRTGESLVSPKVEYSRQIIPAAPAGDYTVRCKLARISPQGGFNIFLPIGNTCVAFGIDKWTGEKVGSSLALIDREGFANGTYVKGSRLIIGKTQVIEATVKWTGQSGTIHVDIVNQPVVRWTDQINRLSTNSGWAITDRTELGVGTDKAIVRLDSIQLRMHSGKAAVSAPSTPPSAESIQPKDGWVELIKLAKPATDDKKHQWKRTGESLVSPKVDYSRQTFPAAPAGDYTVRVTFIRLSKQQGIQVFIPIGNTCAAIVFGCRTRDGVASGLEMVSGKGLGNATSIKGSPLVTGKSHVIEATVKLAGQMGTIHADFDGKPIVRWTGNITQLTPYKGWRVTDRSQFSVGTHTIIQLDSFQLRMLTSEASVDAPSTQNISISRPEVFIDSKNVKQAFGLDETWTIQNGVLAGKCGDVVKGRNAPELQIPINASTIRYGFKMKAKWYHMGFIRFKDRNSNPLRMSIGHWFGEATLVDTPGETRIAGTVTNPSEWNQIEIRMDGKSVSYFYNDRLIHEFKLKTPVSGKEQLSVGFGTYKTSMQVKDLYLIIDGQPVKQLPIAE